MGRHDRATRPHLVQPKQVKVALNCPSWLPLQCCFQVLLEFVASIQDPLSSAVCYTSNCGLECNVTQHFCIVPKMHIKSCF